jgi:transcriptional regulator with XRE-family HTH domain
MHKIKFYRLAHGWTQFDLANKSKVSVTKIHHIEHGRIDALPSELEKIGKALGVCPEDLMGFIDAGSLKSAFEHFCG